MIDEVCRRDLHETTVVLGQDAGPAAPDNPADNAVLLAAHPGNLVLRTSCENRRYLVISEILASRVASRH